MNYTEAIKALLDEKEVEYNYCGNWYKLKMDDINGPFYYRDSHWYQVSDVYRRNSFREKKERRVVFDDWEEVYCFKDAEPVGDYAFWFDGISIVSVPRHVENPENSFWVRRIKEKAVPVEELLRALDDPSRDERTWRIEVVHNVRQLCKKYGENK